MDAPSPARRTRESGSSGLPAGVPNTSRALISKGCPCHTKNSTMLQCSAVILELVSKIHLSRSDLEPRSPVVYLRLSGFM